LVFCHGSEISSPYHRTGGDCCRWRGADSISAPGPSAVATGAPRRATLLTHVPIALLALVTD
jgi:hypothetical protein